MVLFYVEKQIIFKYLNKCFLYNRNHNYKINLDIELKKKELPTIK